MAAVTEFLSLTGVRWSELRALRARDLEQVPNRAIRVSRAQSDRYAKKGTKTGKTRLVPLTRRAWEIASSRAVGRTRTDYLFTGETGLQLGGGLFRRFVRWPEPLLPVGPLTTCATRPPPHGFAQASLSTRSHNGSGMPIQTLR